MKKCMKHLKQNWEIFFPHKKVLQLLAELYFFSKLTHKNQTDRLSRMNLIFSPNCPSIASFEYRLMMKKTFPEFYERSDKRGVISNEKISNDANHYCQLFSAIDFLFGKVLSMPNQIKYQEPKQNYKTTKQLNLF